MTKFLEKNKEALTSGMSFLTIVAFLGFRLFGDIFVNFFEINDTMGWKSGIFNTWIIDIPTYSFLIFLAAYLILYFLRIKTNKVLSVFHLCFIALSSFMFNFLEIDFRIILFIYGVSFIIFGLNIYIALFGKKTIK